MNPQLLKKVVNQVTYYVRYGHGSVEQAIDAAANRNYYMDDGKEFFAGTTEERAEVLAAARAELGEFADWKPTPVEEVKAEEIEANRIHEAARIEAQRAQNLADASKIERAREFDRNFDRNEGDVSEAELSRTEGRYFDGYEGE